jgi:hypothetical protein
MDILPFPRLDAVAHLPVRQACGKLHYGNGFLMRYESQRRPQRSSKATRIRARMEDVGRPGLMPIDHATASISDKCC